MQFGQKKSTTCSQQTRGRCTAWQTLRFLDSWTDEVTASLSDGDESVLPVPSTRQHRCVRHRAGSAEARLANRRSGSATSRVSKGDLPDRDEPAPCTQKPGLGADV